MNIWASFSTLKYSIVKNKTENYSIVFFSRGGEGKAGKKFSFKTLDALIYYGKL